MFLRCAYELRLGAALIVLVVFAGGVHAQVISVAFDPPREMVLGPLDSSAIPVMHTERRGFNVDIDLDTDREVGFKLAYAPDAAVIRRHRLSADSLRFGIQGTIGPLPSVLRRDEGETGVFTPAPDSLFDPFWYPFGGDTAYFPMALPTTGGYRYGWMRISWDADRLLFFGWQLQDQIGVANAIGEAPSVLPDHAPAAFSIRANDLGESGSTTDLEVAFRTTPMATGLSEYRVALFPNRRTKDLTPADVLAVPTGGYTTVLGSAVDPVLAFGGGLLDADLQLVSQDSTYRVVVLSVPDGIGATQPTLVLGPSIQLRLRAKASEHIVLFDSLSLGGTASLYAAFDAAADESLVDGYWCALEHGPELYWRESTGEYLAPIYTGLSAEEVLALPIDRRFFIPATGLSTYTSFLPSGLKDHRGAAVAIENSYRLVVASAPDSSLTPYGFAAQSNWMRYDLNKRQVQNLVADVLRNHEDGRVLRARFGPALDTAAVAAYRLYAAHGSKKSIAALLAIPPAGYVEVIPDGSSSYTVDWDGKYGSDGTPVTANRTYYVHALSIGDSSIWTGAALKRRSGALLGSTVLCRPSPPSTEWMGDKLDPSGIRIVQSLPADSVGIHALRMAITPTSGAFLSEADMTALTPGRYVEYTVSAHDWPLDTSLPASITDAYGAALLPSTAYRVQTQFIPDGIDASVRPISIPSLPLTTVDTLLLVTDLKGMDSGITGTGRDLLIQFNSSPSTTDLAPYRVFVGPESDEVTQSEAESPIPGRFIDVPLGLPSYSLRADALLQTNGEPIGAEGTYRVTVYSINELDRAIGARTTLVCLSDDELRAQALFWTDVADFEDPRDVAVSFVDPTYGDSISEYQIVLLPESPAFSDDEIIASPSVFRHPVPSGSGSYAVGLPAFLPDRSGALMAFDSSYRVAVMSVVPLSSGFRRVVARSPLLPSRATEWPVSALTANVMGDSIEVRFNAAANESFLLEYRLLIRNASDSLPIGEAFFINTFNRLDLPLQGPGMQQHRVSRTMRSADGAPINDGIPKKVYLLSYAGTTDGALVESFGLLTIPVGISPPANPAFSLATAPGHWLLSADLPLEAVEVFDARGRILDQAAPLDLQHRIQTASWPTGTYLIRALVDGSWQELRTALVR